MPNEQHRSQPDGSDEKLQPRRSTDLHAASGVRHGQSGTAGVQDAEIAEAILVARLLKAATVNDTAAEALLWLTQNPASAGQTKAPTSPEGA